MAWDPQQYALFGSFRGRPFADLLARVVAVDPVVVVDLGCGDGPLTLSLTDRWPDARVVGVDSSPQMLEAARGNDEQDRVQWVESTAEAWVMRAGCSMSDSTPPSDSASVNNRVAATILSAASSPPVARKLTMPPKSRICRRAISCPGWSASAG